MHYHERQGCKKEDICIKINWPYENMTSFTDLTLKQYPVNQYFVLKTEANNFTFWINRKYVKSINNVIKLMLFILLENAVSSWYHWNFQEYA